jgi:hypothetical protein
MNRTKIIIVITCAVLFVLVGSFITPILLFLKDYSIVISIFIFVLNYYYFKNEKFYLFVQKNILLPFKLTSTKWTLYGKFSECNLTATENHFEKLKQDIVSAFRTVGFDFVIKKNIANAISISVGNEIEYQFDLETLDNNTNISFLTTRFTVASHHYEKTINNLVKLISAFEQTLHPRDKSYQIQLYFEKKNPYFGFFVRHIPQQLVSNFNCTFVRPNDNSTIVKATKDRITIDAGNTLLLKENTLAYLTLDTQLIMNN